MAFEQGNNYGTKTKRGKAKVNKELKDKLAYLSSEVLEKIDITTLSTTDKLKLLQISISYILPKLRSISVNPEEDMSTDFQIRIIDNNGDVKKTLKIEPNRFKNSLG